MCFEVPQCVIPKDIIEPLDVLVPVPKLSNKPTLMYWV